jgi:aminoglycoside phosphotransferase (APT) family kinase protein
VDSQEVAQILRDTTSTSVGEVWPIAGGWASWMFEVDGHLIVRFPRNAEVAAGTSAEMELLARLGPMVDFEVPTIQARGEHAGWPFFSYERIKGTGLRSADFDYYQGLAGEIAAALRQLHSLPLGVFADTGAAVAGQVPAATGRGRRSGARPARRGDLHAPD